MSHSNQISEGIGRTGRRKERVSVLPNRRKRDLLSVAFFCTLACGLSAFGMKAKPIVETDEYAYGISGYLRTGIGTSKGGNTQANFQVPGAQNKYSLGNQADTYGELEFDYAHYLNDDKSKWIDVVWMVSGYEPQDGDGMEYNENEQLYIKANNLFDNEIDVWFGRRFFERQAIHMLDRQWNNAGQGGIGFGVEGLLDKGTDEDVKLSLFRWDDDDVTSYVNDELGKLYSYSFDARWVHIPLSDTRKLNLNATLRYRPEDEDLGYDAAYGGGLSIWQDYSKGNITDTTAIIFRQGADVPINHWNIASEKENPGNDDIVRNDLDDAWTLEINNNFLYDDQEKWAFNGIVLAQFRDHGTAPYQGDSSNTVLVDPLTGTVTPSGSVGSQVYWLSLGGRAIRYINDQFRLSVEVSNDYIHNEQDDVSGNLSMITFTPEFSVGKGYYTRPVIRPFVTYARWSDDLQGHIGTGPGTAPYGDETDAVTAGIQFEVWW